MAWSSDPKVRKRQMAAAKYNNQLSNTERLPHIEEAIGNYPYAVNRNEDKRRLVYWLVNRGYDSWDANRTVDATYGDFRE